MADMPFTIGRSTSRCCSISSSGSSCTASRVLDGTAGHGLAAIATASGFAPRATRLTASSTPRKRRCCSAAPFSRWWDVVAGVRFDARPAPSHTWFAIGIQGMAPQFLDVQATAFIGQSGHVAARLEVEHDLLITQRLVLQPLVELSLSGADDPDRGIAAGLSTGEVGFRVRYEIRRELAPYAGVVWHKKLFGTGDAARERGEDAGGWHLVSGLRFWF